MTSKYLLHFAHEHISFRWPEFLALTSRHGCKFRLISQAAHIRTRPFIIIELEDGTKTDDLIRSAKSSYLLKGLFELWAESKKTIDDLSDQAAKSPLFLSREYAKPEQTFRVDCESFGSKLTQEKKVDWIRRMVFMETFDSRPNLSNPEQTYCIFEMNEKRCGQEPPLKEYYFGRRVTKGDRAALPKLSLKERVFIANTTMDPMLSMITANTARVKPNDIVYDPFVGSGSFLVAAAHMGAYVLGADIDWLLLHGKSRSSRKGETTRKDGESVRANLRQYNLEHRYLDVLVSDITRCPLTDGLTFDSIISDPPYGIRECSEKIGDVRREKRTPKDHKVRYPSKMSYSMRELLEDLLYLTVKHLAMNGRLVYYLPVTKSENFESFIPTHPSLELVAFCEQPLTAKVSRLMVVMEKIREPIEGNKVNVPQIIDDMNLRETYFSKSDYSK